MLYTNEEIAAVRAEDAKQKELCWQNLINEAGGGEAGAAIADAFKQLYTLYEPALATWYAGLYDPELGAFYSTESGRDYESFGPDLECTAQTLVFITQSGLIGKTPLSEAIPKPMQDKLVHFAKSCQHENGFFYHKHWNYDDQDLAISRRGRDLGWAVRILEYFGAFPTYDTPNGRKGDGIDADGNPIAPSQAAKSNSSGKEQAAGSAKPSPKYASYLENKDTFLQYLGEMDFKNRSYHFGNQLNATLGQINARAKALLEEGAGYDLRELLLDYLDERINPETGYWSEVANMAGSNGLFKTIAVYNTYGRLYPACEAAADSVLESIMGDEIDEGNCCSIFNLWSAVCFIKNNVKKFAPEELRERLLEKVNGVLREKGAAAILNTYKKVLPYKKGAAFNHRYHGNGGTQQGLYTGMPAILGDFDEGNVDASGICSTGLTRVMFEAFGCTRVPLLGKADWMEFLNVINSKEPITKKYLQEPKILLKTERDARFLHPLEGSSARTENEAYELCLNGGGEGFTLESTARLCNGDFFLYESEISLSDIKQDGTLRIAPCKDIRQMKLSLYADLKIKDGKLSVSCDKWSEGFSAELGELPDTLNIRIEYYLASVPRLDNQERKCTAERVYINGRLLGCAINNDGRDPLFPSGSPLNYNGAIAHYSPDGLKAKLRVRSVRYSYPTGREKKY